MDVVTLNCPLHPETEHMVNGTFLNDCFDYLFKNIYYCQSYIYFFFHFKLLFSFFSKTQLIPLVCLNVVLT